MAEFEDLTGQIFGKWTILKRGPSAIGAKTRWICQCGICDQIKMVRASHLKSGVSTKCKECHDRTFNRRHGMYNTSIYGIWEAMIQRCTNPKDKNFYNYGGRGITVCDEWREDFLNFWADMGERPKDLTLDRVDNDKGYCKENCKWRSRVEQQANTRTSHCVGMIYGTWKLITKTSYSKKSTFECIHCKREWCSETNYITSGRCAPCKCIRS